MGSWHVPLCSRVCWWSSVLLINRMHEDFLWLFFLLTGLVLNVSKWVSWPRWSLGRGIWEAVWEVRSMNRLWSSGHPFKKLPLVCVVSGSQSMSLWCFVSEFCYQIDKWTKMGNVCSLFAPNWDLLKVELCANDCFSFLEGNSEALPI